MAASRQPCSAARALDFNLALFMQFAVALPDGKHFGTFASASENAHLLAALDSVFVQPLTHHR
jgi:hypothetical protein